MNAAKLRASLVHLKDGIQWPAAAFMRSSTASALIEARYVCRVWSPVLDGWAYQITSEGRTFLRDTDARGEPRRASS